MKNKTKTQIGCSDNLIVRQTIFLHTKRVPVLTPKYSVFSFTIP